MRVLTLFWNVHTYTFRIEKQLRCAWAGGCGNVRTSTWVPAAWRREIFHVLRSRITCFMPAPAPVLSQTHTVTSPCWSNKCNCHINN